MFALSRKAAEKSQLLYKESENKQDPIDCEPIGSINCHLEFGKRSAIVEDIETANIVHKQNIEILSKMTQEDILAERQNILQTIGIFIIDFSNNVIFFLDPSLVALLANRRLKKSDKSMVNTCTEQLQPDTSSQNFKDVLDDSNAASDLISRCLSEKWINFDIVEKDKLEWMRDIPELIKKLKPGEKFEARFDWKGVLLPYSGESIVDNANQLIEKDERELYLHGDEPHRPGYTLQELFRLARYETSKT